MLLQNVLIVLSEIFSKDQFSEKGESNWIDVILPTKTNLYNNKLHSSTKLPPVRASSKKNEGFVYRKLLDKRKKIKPKFQVKNPVRTTDLKKTFSKFDRKKWLIKLYKITEINNDITPAYKIEYLPET